jgi:hypothetical protein
LNYKKLDSKKNALYLYPILFFNLYSLFSYLTFFKKNHYLPNPFVGDKSDTFMDFFNPLYWGYQAGVYSDWHSIYPPLNFLILKAIHWVMSGQIIYNNALDFRSYAIADIWGFIFLYFLSIALLIRHKAWSIFSLKEKILLYFIIATSVPMLYALERGNLIIIALFILPFVFSNNRTTKALSIAVITNIKPYFFLFLIYFVIKKEWKNLTISVAAMCIIFILSSIVLGVEVIEFFKSMIYFNDHQIFDVRELLTFPSSINIGQIFFQYEQFAQYDKWNLMLKYFLSAASITIIALVIKLIFFRASKIYDSHFFMLIILLISNLIVSAGGYSLIYYVTLIPFLFLLRYRLFYFVIMSILFIDLDLFNLFSRINHDVPSFLGGRVVDVFWYLGSGSLIRPILNILLLLVVLFELNSLNKKFNQI